MQYEATDDRFKASEGTFRTKVVVGDEESYGGGNNAVEAKQAAAMQVMYSHVSLLARH